MTTAQQPDIQQPTGLLALAVGTARRNPYGSLASADDAGRPHVRLMQHLASPCANPSAPAPPPRWPTAP